MKSRIKSSSGIILIAFLIAIISCREKKKESSETISNENLPNCIVNLRNNPPGNLDIHLISLWKNDTVTYYYLKEEGYDTYGFLYDQDCNYICAPTGGLTGDGKRDCPEFNEEFVKTILWESK